MLPSSVLAGSRDIIIENFSHAHAIPNIVNHQGTKNFNHARVVPKLANHHGTCVRILVGKETRNILRLLPPSLELSIEDPIAQQIMKLLVEIMALGKVGEVFLQKALEDLRIATHNDVEVSPS